MGATMAATCRMPPPYPPPQAGEGRVGAAMWEPRGPRLHSENFGVACPDFFAEPLHRGRVLLHQLDFAKRSPAGLLLDLRVKRTHSAPIDHELLAFGAEAEALKQSRRVRIGRRFEEAIRRQAQSRSLARIHRFDRAAGFLDLKQDIFVAVRHHRAFAQPEFLWGVGGGLHLHHALLCELFEKVPADIARYLLGRGHDGAAITRMALDDLPDPFRIEQIRETLRRILRFDEPRIVPDHAAVGAIP